MQLGVDDGDFKQTLGRRSERQYPGIVVFKERALKLQDVFIVH